MNKWKLLMLLFVVKACTIHISFSHNTAQQNCPNEKPQNPDDGICKSIDVRRTAGRFKLLENCVVIEGFLRISNFEVAKNDTRKYKFPKLVEITDYLLFFRVKGLTTLGDLFPNLAVIRGRIPFNNYAFVVWEMFDLENIGLAGLRSINGGVRVARNPKLCYLETVDWTRLGVKSVAQEFSYNRLDAVSDTNLKECPIIEYCAENCPSTSGAGRRCWSTHRCQQILDCDHCKREGKDFCMKAPSDVGVTCCDKLCLGGCRGRGPDKCLSCKNVIYKGKCHDRCPIGTYKYYDRRCLSDAECLALRNNSRGEGKAKILKGDDTIDKENGEDSLCVTECPDNFQVSPSGEECIKCEGFCPKVCNGTDIRSMEDIINLKGCSKISGTLFIDINYNSPHIGQALETNLGELKEITGQLSIRRALPLTNLRFFRKLEIIRGDSLSAKQATLVIMDNTNLQELFPEEQMAKSMPKILKGVVQIHSNRKLCYHDIESYLKKINLTFTEDQVSQTSNGDLRPCAETQLELKKDKVMHNTVVLSWEKHVGNSRSVLEYTINYKEVISKNDNLDIFQGRDACSDNGWMTQEQRPTDDVKSLYQKGVITGLRPHTTYATYVQAYVLDSATHTSMTKVIYFTTKPYYPTEPTQLTVRSEHPNELIVEWKPPKFPNGNVTHYKVIYRKQELSPASFQQRDYCEYPSVQPKAKPRAKVVVENKKKSTNMSDNCCACPKSQEQLNEEERLQKLEHYFEDYIHKHIYCKRYDKIPDDIDFSVIMGPGMSVNDFEERTSGNISKTQVKGELAAYTTEQSQSVEAKKEEPKVYKNTNVTNNIQEVEVYQQTKTTLPNLEHYQEYSIEVQACQDTTLKDNITKLCSFNRAITLGRTKAAANMDRVNFSSITVELITNSSHDVLVKWSPPEKPNGVILKYYLWVKKANQENLVVPQKVCVSIMAYKRHSGGYKLTGLDPGNWTFQIEPISLAGNGTKTPEKPFVIYPPPGNESSDKGTIIAVILSLLCLIIVALIFGLFYKLKFQQKEEPATVVSTNPHYMPSSSVYKWDDKWEVDRKKIRLIKELGSGSFGMVYEGTVKGLRDDAPDEEIPVAVKTVNDRASFNDKKAFLGEATTMKAFDTYHVVKLIGVVSQPFDEPALVIMELMALGDLKNYLRQHRPEENSEAVPPNLLDVLQMAGEIADGMAYLAANKYVHRDLAARNCMIDANRSVKIGDFGMTRDVYQSDYYRIGTKGMLPIRWMAPESLELGTWTSMSDVWSYGVVMWEMVTLANQPYMGLSNEEVVQCICDGYILDVPNKCPAKMATLMERCWAKKPKERITFMEILQYLKPHLSKEFEKLSYFHNESGGGSSTLTAPGNSGDEGGSLNSLDCEGAAAARPLAFADSSGDWAHGDNCRASSLYGDMNMHEEGYSDEDIESGNRFPNDCDLRGTLLNGMGGLRDECNSLVESGLDIDEARQPFMSVDFESDSHTPASYHSAGDHRSDNSGHIELQPLINREKNIYTPESSSLQHRSSLHNSYPYSSPVNTSTQLPLSTYSHDTETGSPHSSGPSDLSQRLSTAQPQVATSPPTSFTSNGTHPTSHRLPPLNQPPGIGSRQTPLASLGAYAGDRNKYNKTRNFQTNSNEHHPTFSVPTKSRVVNKDVRLNGPLETSLNNVNLHEAPTPDVITSSNEGSKESCKSSGNHSLSNGLTNGHIPTSLNYGPASC